MSSSPGIEFAEALADKDFARVEAVLDPAVDFRGMTPSRTWESGAAAAVTADILAAWFEPGDTIDEVVSLAEGEPVADRRLVSYRFRGHNEDGAFVVEQQAYYSEEGGRITWMRVLCSGFRRET